MHHGPDDSGFKFPLNAPGASGEVAGSSVPPVAKDVSEPAGYEPVDIAVAPPNGSAPVGSPPSIHVVSSSVSEEPASELSSPKGKEVPTASTIDEAIANFHDAVNTPLPEEQEKRLEEEEPVPAKPLPESPPTKAQQSLEDSPAQQEGTTMDEIDLS